MHPPVALALLGPSLLNDSKASCAGLVPGFALPGKRSSIDWKIYASFPVTKADPVTPALDSQIQETPMKVVLLAASKDQEKMWCQSRDQICIHPVVATLVGTDGDHQALA